MGKRKEVPKEITEIAKSLAGMVHRMDLEKANYLTEKEEFSKKG